MAHLAWVRVGDRWSARLGDGSTATISRGPNREYPWRLRRGDKVVSDFLTVAYAKAKAEREWAGRRRTKGGYHTHPAHPYSHPVATRHRRG